LRIAGLMACNERAWSIDDDYIQRAIRFVDSIKHYGTELFTGAKENVTSLKLAKRIRTIILAAGDAGISHTHLYRSCSISGRAANELRTLLETMHELDLIKMYEIENPRSRPRRMYVATEFLKNELFLEDVARKLGVT